MYTTVFIEQVRNNILSVLNRQGTDEYFSVINGFVSPKTFYKVDDAYRHAKLMCK